jgi:hypothetical protein
MMELRQTRTVTPIVSLDGKGGTCILHILRTCTRAAVQQGTEFQRAVTPLMTAFALQLLHCNCTIMAGSSRNITSPPPSVIFLQPRSFRCRTCCRPAVNLHSLSHSVGQLCCHCGISNIPVPYLMPDTSTHFQPETEMTAPACIYQAYGKN